MPTEQQAELRVFLSWSGERSKAVAQAFRGVLPRALQNVQPYCNTDDTSRGSRWETDIRGELENCDFGIIFLTPENLTSPWILFEAGALSKLARSKVVPFLLGLEPTDVSGPLTQFQAVKPNHSECLDLFKSLNESLGKRGLAPDVLRDIFDRWWPDLDSKITSAMETSHTSVVPVRRSERELIEETLERVRRIETWTPSQTDYSLIIYETAQTMWRSIECTLERIVMDLQHSDDECSSRCLSLIREIEDTAMGFAAHPRRDRGG